MKTIAFIAAVLLSFAAPVFAAAPNMQEGNWEIVTSIAIEGMPFPLPPLKVTQCFTKKDLEDGSKTRPAAGGSGKKNDCEVKDLQETGNSAAWKVICKDGSNGSGQASYQGSTYSLTQKVVGKSGSGATTTTIKAKRLGDCK